MPAYSKTNWVDGSVPAIDATNLNKIEQGIFDSLRQDGSTTMSGQLVTTAGSVATPAIAPTGDANTGIFFPAADTIAFGEGGLEAMRINSAGNVGIGTTNPSYKLDVRTGSASFEGSSGVDAVRIAGAGGSWFWLDNPTSTTFRISSGATAGNNPFILTSAGNVGIGTTSPTEKLQVNATSGNIGLNINTADSGAVSYISLSNTGASGKRYSLNVGGNTIGSGLTNNLFLYDNDNAAVRFLITPSGNVGIGTTSPTSELHVYANGGVADLMVETNTTGGDSKIALKCNGTGGRHWYFQTGDNASTLNGRLRIFDNTAGAERLTITSTGNVGIGTDSPTAYSGYTTLAINNSTNGGVIEFQANKTQYSRIVSTSGGLFFSTSNNDRMTITSAGNVGIGTTSPTPNASRNTLSINGAQGGVLELFTAGTLSYQLYPSSSTNPELINYNVTNNSGTHIFSVNGTERMRLTSAGYLLIGYASSNGAYPLQVNGQIFATSSTIATSDGRYKKDVVALDGALDIVKALNPVQFSWKEHPVHKFNTDVPTVGFIAQEVEQALADKSYLTSIIKKSECTWETETGETIEREVTRDVEKQVEREITEEIDGEEVTRTVTETVIEQVTEIVTEAVKETHTEEFLGIAESNLIAILTKAVKELAAEVEALKAQLNK